MSKPTLLAIVGPTASGKTGLAMQLAELLPCEIINVDSMQVYRELSVGTDKPTPQMRARVPFHVVDIADPSESFDAARMASLADEAVHAITARHKLPIACGGTGLYHRALLYGLVAAPPRDDAVRDALRARRDEEGQDALFAELGRLDPESAQRTHPGDWVRIERALEVHAISGRPLSSFQQEHGFARARYRTLTIGCTRARERLYAAMDARLTEMWSGGLLEETRMLMAMGLSRELLPLKALGYRHAAAFLAGEVDEAEALRLALRDTRHFARRQLTWFRKDTSVRWVETPVDGERLERLAAAVRAFGAGAEPEGLDALEVRGV